MIRRWCLVLMLWFGGALFAPAAAQKAVNINLARATFIDSIPFAEEFVLQGKVLNEIDSVYVWYRRDQPGSSFKVLRWLRSSGVFSPETTFYVTIDPLLPDQDYTFCVAQFGPDSLPWGRSESDFTDAPGCAWERWEAASGATALSEIDGRPRSSWRHHFDQDLGVMTSFNADYTGLVTAVHLHPLPYNRSADLYDHGSGLLRQLGTRLSLFGGISPIEIHSGAEQPIKKTALGVPVVGVGVRGILYWTPNGGGFYDRFIQPIRLDAGVMFFDQDDPNPLVDKNIARRDVFVALTADIELKDVLGPIAGLFGIK